VKVLYAIQGTGNGHVSRAREIAPVLERYCEVDYLISGRQVELELSRKVKYRTRGLSLYFGKNGGVDMARTFSENSYKDIKKEIRDLPVENYDLVLNDFEPTSAWAAKKKGIRCVGLSHQCALRSPNSPRPKQKDYLGMTIINHYAPANEYYGFHFNRFDKMIYTPIIRSDLRMKMAVNNGHYTVYLPSYDDARISKILQLIPDVSWQVFSKRCKSSYETGNVRILPVHDRKFAMSILSCEGVLCGAGFETPSEALFLGKKLLVIPMKNQYEQKCNAEALKTMGVPVLKSLKKKHVPKLMSWVESTAPDRMDYPDQITEIIETVLHQR
jgi:uncharacterized protein (TIGR00661 family)